MKKSVLVLSLTICFMGLSPVALADLNSFLMDVNKQALSDINNFNKKLSKQFGIPIPDAEAIIRSVPKPEDAFMILQLSQMSRKAPEVVLQTYQRSKGKGWGKLAQELGIKPGSREFHALKRGELSFTGEHHGHAEEHGEGRGKGNGKIKDKGKGRGRD